MPKLVANNSEQFMYSDNTWNKFEFYRLNQSTTEAENLTVGRNRANLATIKCSEFIVKTINSEKINKTDSNKNKIHF